MKFKKPTSQNAIDTVIQALSLGTGVMLSKGAVSLLPADKQTSLIKGGVSLASLLVSAIIKGDTTFDKSVRSAFIGMGLEQGVSAISAELGKVVETKPDAVGVQKFLQASLGLGAGVDGPVLLDQSLWDNSAPRQEAGRVSVNDMSA